MTGRTPIKRELVAVIVGGYSEKDALDLIFMRIYRTKSTGLCLQFDRVSSLFWNLKTLCQ